MIDTQIESSPKFPVGTMVFLPLAILLTAASIQTGKVDWAIGSIPCWTIALTSFLARERGFFVTITSDGLDLRDTGQFISFDSIVALVFHGRMDESGKYSTQQAPIHLTHDGGEISIPSRINVPSNELYTFLCNQFEPRQLHSLNHLLSEFADEQAATFGEEMVYRCVARNVVRQTSVGGTTAKTLSGGMMLASIGWFMAAYLHDSAWVAGGIPMLLLGFLVYLLGLAKAPSPASRIKNWQDSGLVISPVGLALVQGPLKGRMQWDELRSVKFVQGPRAGRLSAGVAIGGILLQVDGSSMIVADIYNQPLSSIYSQIMKYWRGDS